MKNTLFYTALFLTGFFSKVVITEVKEFRDTQLLDRDIGTDRWEGFERFEEYESTDPFYKVADTLNYQPGVWKLLADRCTSYTEVEGGISNQEFFHCNWQLKFLKLFRKATK